MIVTSTREDNHLLERVQEVTTFADFPLQVHLLEVEAGNVINIELFPLLHSAYSPVESIPYCVCQCRYVNSRWREELNTGNLHRKRECEKFL
jgi:hypothetical protein